MGAVGKVTVEQLGLSHRACNTWTEAFGWAAARKLACRVGHAVVIEQTLVSLTEECDTRLVGILPDSWLRPP